MGTFCTGPTACIEQILVCCIGLQPALMRPVDPLLHFRFEFSLLPSNLLCPSDTTAAMQVGTSKTRVALGAQGTLLVTPSMTHKSRALLLRGR